MLWTTELQPTIDFYTGILGFTCIEKNQEWGWASLCRGNAEVMLARPNEHAHFEKPVFTGSLYFEVENADDLWAQWKDKVRICYEIENFSWGMREFAVYDNNGYVLQFGHPVNS